jgi:hypothetical protein
MVFETTIKYTSVDGYSTIEINESPTEEKAKKWVHHRVVYYYKLLVGVDDNNCYVLPNLLNNIMNNLDDNDDKDEDNYKIDIIKFVIEMQNKYEKKRTIFTIHEIEK